VAVNQGFDEFGCPRCDHLKKLPHNEHAGVRTYFGSVSPPLFAQLTGFRPSSIATFWAQAASTKLFDFPSFSLECDR
jgi:hypothetical protein